MTDTVTAPTADQSYRITFDEFADVGPLTYRATASVDQLETWIIRAFAAENISAARVRIHLATGDVQVIDENGAVIERGTITAPEPTAEPHLRQRFAAELHRIADDIVRLELPLKETMCGDLSVGVLGSRADLERWADYLGSTVETDPGNNIPSTRHRILLDGRPYGAWLGVRAQIQPDQPSELEAARARVAELEARLAEGGAK